MRAVLLAAAGAIGTLSLGACANDGPTPQELQEQVRRGATGGGQITPEIDRSDDPYVKPREGGLTTPGT